MPRGIPQIEVVFDIDANGILNVSASEKSTGKSQKIAITNDKGRLSKEDIERMVEEAETYKVADQEVKEKIEAKCDLENYFFSTKKTVCEDMKDKTSDLDKEQLKSKISELEDNLQGKSLELKEVYSEWKKELETIFADIMERANASSESPSTSTETPIQEEPEKGPSIEEVD